ncbi:uncharacterized protein LOC127737321 [Mytilus californianus]|uniref:uncharacterized protein LOC127737321 n=1 Tax=Mytilus californianus TaxID=6549 RepID=UPI0022459908|nr:uncharacterized protein LOC127737321 [Mytilus californianus]XP_052103871.1 uncharacterized protein LOC127737321 [Mytilus californianus]XP_052103872.1 uncharacterized protein LOC127737321 [Mytilus californianus]
MEALFILSVSLLLIFPVVLTSRRTVGFSKNDCNKYHVILSQNDTFGVDWMGLQYPKHCTLPFKVQDANLYRLCADVTVFEFECPGIYDEVTRAVVFYRGNDRSQQKKYDCHDKLPITFCSGSETLSIELEPYYKDIRQTNSKLKIIVATSLKTTSNYIEKNNGGGSILIGVVATCIIFIIILFACVVILIRRRRRYSKKNIDNNIQGLVRQSEELQQSQQTGGEHIDLRLLSGALNVDSQYREARPNNQPHDHRINEATMQRNEWRSSRSGQASLSTIETHAPPSNDHYHMPVTSRTNHPRFDNDIERNIEHIHGRQHNGRNPTEMIEPSAPPLNRTHDFQRPFGSQPNQSTIDQVVDGNITSTHGRTFNDRNPPETIQRNAPQRHEQPTEQRSTHPGSSRDINTNGDGNISRSSRSNDCNSTDNRDTSSLLPPSYHDVMNRSSDFDLR